MLQLFQYLTLSQSSGIVKQYEMIVFTESPNSMKQNGIQTFYKIVSGVW